MKNFHFNDYVKKWMCLLYQCLEEFVEGCCGIAMGLQQLYKLRTDDGTSGILLGRL